MIRLVSKGTIEENILSLAEEKLLLEKEVSKDEGNLGEVIDYSFMVLLTFDSNGRQQFFPQKTTSQRRRVWQDF